MKVTRTHHVCFAEERQTHLRLRIVCNVTFEQIHKMGELESSHEIEIDREFKTDGGQTALPVDYPNMEAFDVHTIIGGIVRVYRS